MRSRLRSEPGSESAAQRSSVELLWFRGPECMSDFKEGSLTNPGDVMENLLSEEEIFAKLSVILQEALRIGTTKIRPEARVFDDLGAESLDLLDIRFRVDESFGVKTSDEDLIRSLGEGLTAEDIQEKLTVRSLVLYIQNCLQEKSQIL